MGGGGSETRTEIDPEFKPFLKFGLEEAKRLYQGVGGLPETLAVGPSSATQQALMMAEQRALAGSPLTRQAQSTVMNMMGNYSPYESGYQSMFGQSSPYQAGYQNMISNAYTDPSRSFYEQLRGGQFQNEALGGVRATSQGAYLGGNPYLEGALGQSNRLSAEALQEGLRGLSSQTAAAGRMGSGAEQQLTGKAVDAAARAIAEANQQAYAQNYATERGLQEAALARLGGLSQQDVQNRLSGAQQLTSSGQQEFANRMAALQGAQNIYQSDFGNRMSALSGAQGVYQQNLANQMAAAQFAPQLAAQDYADIQRLLQVGQGREAYDRDAILGRIKAQELPLDFLKRATDIFQGTPLETRTATSGGK
jgi:hypothetical protein